MEGKTLIEAPKNPIMERILDPSFDAKNLTIPYSYRGKVKKSREIRRLLRKETATEAIGKIYPRCAIFGITKGQFSLIELITAILEQTGPANLFISTWTAAGADLTDAFELIESGRLLSCRFLVDHTFQRRRPAFAAKIRDLFGVNSVRVTKNHAKFSLIFNDQWDLVLQTSMNLNYNPRLEDFCLEDDPRLAKFLRDLMDEIFEQISPKAILEKSFQAENRFKKLKL